MTVQDLIDALQAVDNPQVTLVTLDDSAGANLDTVDLAGVIHGGIDLDDGGVVDLVGAA
jgi:hypothetical protein